jgi:hypothetical protein
MSTKLLAAGVALALILLPEPVTTATGTLMGFAILAGTFATGGGFV